MPLEVERKYLNVDFASLREQLHLQGASGGVAHFESNSVFDTGNLRLVSSGCLLRLRTQEWMNSSRHILTFKKPVDGLEHFKTRSEVEMEIADANAMQCILEGMGYGLQARYEKIREEWELGRVKIVLDTLPFDCVVEMEGEPDAITTLEIPLGLDKVEVSTDSYHSLHMAWLKKNNLPAEPSFIFDESARRLWRSRLGLRG